MGRTADESEVSQHLVELVVPDLGSLFLPIEVPDHLDAQSFASGTSIIPCGIRANCLKSFLPSRNAADTSNVANMHLPITPD